MFTILIVDDEPYICKGLGNLLATSGLSIRSVLTASDAYEALDLLRMEEVDLLVTDIQMGAMNGIELMHQAKFIKPWLQTIIISAHETFQYAQMAIRLGARDYLIKPINSEQFLDSVRSVLLKLEKPVTAGETDKYLAGFRNDFKMKEPSRESARLLAALFAGQEDEAIFVRLAREFGVRLSGPYFSVTKIILRWQESPKLANISPQEAELLRYAALNIVNELLDGKWEHQAFASSEQGLSLILEWDEARYSQEGTNKINQLEMIGRSLHFNIEKFLGFSSTIGISQVLKGKQFLAELAGQAGKAIDWNREHKDHDVFYYGDFNWGRYRQDDPTEEELTARNNLIVDSARDFINRNFAQKGLTVHEVAESCHVSPNYLSYLFKKNTGYNLWEYVIKLRMEESKNLLLNRDMRRYEIAEAVGYESPEHFSKIFKKYFGCSPSEIKK